jgi:hypothetical protein
MWDKDGKRRRMRMSDPMNLARELIFQRDDFRCAECKLQSPIRLAVHTHSYQVECLSDPILEHYISMCTFCYRKLYVKHGEAEYVAF